MVFEGRQGSKPTMMVLHNPELLESILQYLHTSKTTLISASLTATAFSEPAFNVLWYESSLWPLFRILPEFERGTNGKYAFTEVIRNERLQRVLYYAKRIRFLNYKDFDVDKRLYAEVPRSLITSTIMRIDKLGVFIPLRKIQLCDPLRDIMLLPLTVPNLEDIEIATNLESFAEATEIGLASFLHSIASQSSLLRSLAIKGSFRDITFQILPDFVNLHSLSMFLCNPDIHPHFLNLFASSMPSLRMLRIAIIELTPRDRPQRLEQPDSGSQSSFPSLEILFVSLWGNSIHLENLFGGLDVPLLESGTLVLCDITPDVGAHIERNREVLNDNIHTLIIDSVDRPFILVEPFENLWKLEIVASQDGIPTSSIMDTLNHGGSWLRSLTHLLLVQTTPLNGMSIAALYLIADACPNLESLEISIHDPEKPKMPTVKKDGHERQPHDLEQLVFLNLPAVWNDSISLAVELVSLLDHLFPSMTVPKYTGGEKDKPRAPAKRAAWWQGVEDMWKMCQSKNQKMPESNSLCRCRH